MPRPQLGIVIPTLVGGKRLASAIASLEEAVPPGAGALVVVIDGPDRGPEGEKIQLDVPRAATTILRLGVRAGFAAAVNRGVAALKSETEWLAIVNDDVLLDRQWFEKLHLDQTPQNVGGLACEIRFDPERHIVNSRGIAWTRSGWAFEIDSGRHISETPSKAPILGPAGAVALYRHQAWMELKGFDTRFWAYGEDVDFAWRLSSSGWRTESRLEALAYHAQGATSGQASPLKSYLSSRNRTLLRAKLMSSRDRMRYLHSELAREGLWLARDAEHRCVRAWLRGKRDGLRGTFEAARAGKRVRESARAVPCAANEGLLSAIRRKHAVDVLAAGTPPPD